ncbi:carbohydrate sulfotransferase 6-like isoform X2 [Hyperolius riggenbachi]|uniref:carbohydrate sulfotransferase 6-like isoform X2 n=1 Tax=Hyperolius riggenbachi TaxID=752182 RepID=UPI0035A2EBE0
MGQLGEGFNTNETQATAVTVVSQPAVIGQAVDLYVGGEQRRFHFSFSSQSLFFFRGLSVFSSSYLSAMCTFQMMSPRIRLLSLLFIAFMFFCLPQFLFNKPFSISYLPSFSLKRNPVHLLVVSSWRSGSSFVGQIFNHHSDVFYFFEPGYPIWIKLPNESSELLHYPLRDLLRSLFTCDVSSLRHYLPKGGKHIDELRFFAETRAFCMPPACSAFVPSEEYNRLSCYHRCRDTSLDTMAEICKTYSHVVMKTVRIFDLSVLLPLFRDPALDLRILHLVRDPRAIASSRKYFVLNDDNKIVLKNEGNTNITISRVMKKICKSQVDINSVAKAAQTFQGRYMAIRHEDLSNEPLKYVKEIYKFASLPLTKDLEQWLYNVTNKEEGDGNNNMTFSRESSKVIQKWRSDLDFGFVEEIQKNCKEAMDLFGYLPARSQSEQKGCC